MPDHNANPITIRLPKNLETEHGAALHAYLLNGDGQLVETAAFQAHTARLAAPPQALQSGRLFIAPGLPAEFPDGKIDAFALAAAGAYQVSATPGARNQIDLQHLPPTIVQRPIFHFCNVQGSINNVLTLNGISQSGPVCKAKVHICTVDWYYRWPIWLRPIIPQAVINRFKDTIAVRRAQPRHAAGGLKRLPTALEDRLLAATADNIHDIVRQHAELIYPHLCYYPIFWPWFYRIVEQEIAYTDCNGYFDGWLAMLGAGAENIYIWAEANIDGVWTTIYNPPFPCNTYWNYVCGTEISISLANAAIPPCNCGTSVVDGTIWFTAIGGSAIASSIQQDVTSSYAPAGLKNVGCTNLFDANQLCPFGSTLNLYLATGPTLPATHYRWSWTYIMDSSGNPITGASANPIAGAVSRYYLWPLGDGSWESGSIALQDTDADGNIAYFLPNYDVTTYPGVSPLAEWVSFNFLGAALDSTKIFNGYVIRLDLELVNKNAGGVFETVSVPVTTFQVSSTSNSATGYGGSTPAPYTANGAGQNYLTLDPSASGNALSFSLKVRVDNAPVAASINDALLLSGGGVSSGPCGFIQFSDASQQVSLSFVASEPFDFATFTYSLVKGSSGPVFPAASGYVFADAAPFSLAGGTYTDTTSVAALLGTCAQAAFAETLTVSSLATDGSIPLSETGYPYAAGDTKAFALTPS